MEATKEKILIIEPYYGGSHKKLLDVICTNLPTDSYKLITMTPKKWHWRARTSALYIATQIPKQHSYQILFCTSVLPLAELLGLRQDLVPLKKVIYFHENQLVFPVRVIKDRDYQYAYNEILSCLSADIVLFNSNYNKDSFLSHINRHLKLQPDYKVKDLDIVVKSKSKVIYYPLDLIAIDRHLLVANFDPGEVLRIVWPHRWEFDKNPEAFYQLLCKLEDNGYKFEISILGESFSEKPNVFTELSKRFQSKLLHCGYVENVADYYAILQNSDVVISTAVHEFFGVAVLEAIYCGCIPVVPNRLSYKELYEGKVEEVYNSEEEMYTIVASLCEQKLNGNLHRNYSHLALPYNSNKWINVFLETIDFNPQ